MFDIHLYDVTCENKPGSPSQLFILQVMERWKCEEEMKCKVNQGGVTCGGMCVCDLLQLVIN